MKTTKTPDHNPTGRTRPKRKMGTVLRAKLSKYRARVSEFEDDAPSSTVVRWLVVLLLLHLLVIGGVYVRSTWFRNTAETVEMAAALPAPPQRKCSGNLILTCMMFIEAKTTYFLSFFNLWFNTFRYSGLLKISCSLTI